MCETMKVLHFLSLFDTKVLVQPISSEELYPPALVFSSSRNTFFLYSIYQVKPQYQTVGVTLFTGRTSSMKYAAAQSLTLSFIKYFKNSFHIYISIEPNSTKYESKQADLLFNTELTCLFYTIYSKEKLIKCVLLVSSMYYIHIFKVMHATLSCYTAEDVQRRSIFCKMGKI